MSLSISLQIFLVATGGAFGSVARFLLGLLITNAGYSSLTGVTLVNWVGCFVVGWFMSRPVISPSAQLLISTGILGGFTTFSAFGLLTVQDWNARGGVPALGLAVVHVVVGIVAVWIGMRVSHL